MKKQQLIDLLGGVIEIEVGGKLESYPISGIEIPIIQRDYAQGRPEERLILDRFLTALFNALSNDEELELDFVYGSVRADGIFLPLDGQQRLTTLFLLHWYIANAELPKEQQLVFQERLKRFRYATRSTASRFCAKLTEVTETKSTADNIRKAYWFHKNFEKDPTVIAMLNTIDEIEQRYQGQSKQFFERLHRLCFYLLPLDGFNLTDELYIKMNARGKQLTDFENFKADLIGRLKDDSHPEKKHFNESTKHGVSTVPYYLAIASKMDNNWTDIFWPTARKKVQPDEKDRTVDPYFLRFVNRYLLNHHILYAKGSATEIENSSIFRHLYGQLGNDTNLRYQQFNAYEALITAKVMARFERLMDNLHQHQDEIRQLIRPAWDVNDDWFLFDDKINQTQRILFLAVSLYLEQVEFQPESFKAWIRVSWNLIIDPDIRSVGAMITAMRTIARLAVGCADIYTFFDTEVFESQLAETNTIHGEQLSEERQKATLFKDGGWQTQIFKAEAHYLFQGNIGFLLWDKPDLPLFERRVSHAFLLFDRTGANRNFREDHGVYRYVIGSLKTWKAIESFTFIDDYRTWQLGLRRHATYKVSIAALCSFLDIIAIHQEIDTVLSGPSNVSAHDALKIHKVHENLYQHEEFVRWTQKSEKVSKIKMLYERIYIIRPSAWYDKVMIEGYRNEVISSFLRLIKIGTEHRCGSSDFFWGEDVNIGLKANNNIYILKFARNQQVTFSRRKDTDEQQLFDEFYKASLTKVNSPTGAQQLVEEIVNALLSSIKQDKGTNEKMTMPESL